MSREFYTETDLANFKECQRLAYEAVVAVAKKLKTGDSERDAAQIGPLFAFFGLTVGTIVTGMDLAARARDPRVSHAATAAC